MGSEWNEANLTDLYEISSGLSKSADSFGSGYPFLSFKDVFYNVFAPENLSQLVQTTAKEQESCSIKRGDVFLTRTSETMHELGMSCVALKNYESATFNGFTKRLRPKPINELVPEYVGYYLRSPKFRAGMLAFSTMSTRASLNNEMIGKLKIQFPKVEAQRSIAGILKSLDSKIHLNRQLNQTLEHMAQALFKSWFVDFDPVIDNALAAGNAIPEELQDRAERRQRQLEKADHKPLPENIRNLFPSEFELTESLGWVPRGWEIKYLNDISRIVYGKNLPKTKILDEGYPVYGGNGIIGFFDRYLYDSPHVLVSCRGAASGKVHLSKPFIFVTNNSLVIEHEKSYLSPLYIYQALLEQDLTSLTTGSAQPQMTIENMNPVQLLVPSREIMAAHLNIAQSNHNKYLANIIINEELEKLRDTLLPKLISGELRIPEAQGLVEEVLG